MCHGAHTAGAKGPREKSESSTLPQDQLQPRMDVMAKAKKKKKAAKKKS